MFMTIAKSGTHLLKKTIEKITNQSSSLIPLEEYPQFAQDPAAYFASSKDAILGMHLFPEFDPLVNHLPRNFTKIVLVRDLRDVVISILFFKHRMNFYLLETYPYLSKVITFDFEKELFRIIPEEDTYYAHSMARHALLWLNDPTVLLVRFEDLVGPLGGGDSERQKKTIQSLSHHLGVDLSESRTETIANSLFGESRTFRKGQIHAWHDYFQESHKQLFKQVMGKELIALGYEKDDSW